jgi:hypothetical protein
VIRKEKNIMSILETFIKNNCTLLESWKDKSIDNLSNLKNILSTSKEELFCYASIYYNKAKRNEFIGESDKVKQVLEDMETFVLPYDILHYNVTILKSPHNDGMYLADDRFATVLFSYDEKTNKIEVYDIYTNQIYQFIDDCKENE